MIYTLCENNHVRIYHPNGDCPLCEKGRLYNNALKEKLKCVEEIEDLQKKIKGLRKELYCND